MPIQFEAYVNIAADKGYDIFNHVGAIIVHIDRDVIEGYGSQIKMQKVKEATDYFGPLYAIEIPETTPIAIQHWVIQSVQEGKAQDLLEKEDPSPTSEDTSEEN